MIGASWSKTLRSGSPIESHWPEVSQLQITWKENWDATYKANWDQWNTEAQQLKNNNDKTRYLGVRRARLLDSLIDRFPEETEKRNEARFELAGYLHKKGFVGSGNRYLDQIIVESPGSLDLAVRALRTILEKTPVVRAHQIAQGEAWIEYAARRMLTVYRYGDDSYLEATALALQSLTELRLSQGRWLDARQTLSLLRELSVLDDSVRSLEDKLDGAALRDVPLQAARTAPPYEQDRWRNQLVVAQRELLDGKGDDLQMILSADEQRRRILSAGGNRQTSMWTLVRQFLLEQDQDALAPLRKSQEEEAAFQMGSLAASPSDAELFSVYRRFPLANSSHKALVRLGLGSLVQGHIGIARRSFQDALTFSNNGEILSRARSGLWLALAQKAEDETELRESFDGISLKQEFPWFGAKPTASTIREELMAGRRPPSVRPMQASALRPMALPLPEHPAWDHPLLEITHPDILEGLTPLTGQIQALRNGVLVSGPNLLAWYEGELDRPKWLKSNPLSMGVSGMASTRVRSTRTFTVPGPVRPSSRGGRIYARWGLRSSKGTMRSVAAFDAETGELIWTTAKEPNWHERSPVSDPVAADGRVFVIVLQRGKSPAPFFLVCLDAQDGKLMWEQHLADQVITQSGEANLFGRGMANYHFDFVHFGNRVTVEAGAVYCQANMGVVAKLDARDGHIDWLHLYE
ncbi:MAG: PQQ-binding-like beta-propeller repeat protein, partial [Planctomycetota bacterium]|nr:PQQ-binding-like beta-propeller repeat protein [Planctomycetota bacterium]